MNILQIRQGKNIVTSKASQITDITCCNGEIRVFFEHKEPQLFIFYGVPEKLYNLYNDLLSAWILSLDTQSIVIVNIDEMGFVYDWKIGSMTDLLDDLMM